MANARGARFVRPLVGCAVSVLLVGIVLRTVDLTDLGDAWARFDARYLVLAVPAYLVGVWIRAYRWGLLIPGVRVPACALFRAMIVGSTINNFIPARVGDVARAHLLATEHGVPYASTLASVVTEKIFDGLALALLLLVALPFVGAPGYLLAAGLVIGSVFGAALGVAMLVAWRADLAQRLVDCVTMWLPVRLRARGQHLGADFVAGIAQVGGARSLFSVLGLSLAGWLGETGLVLAIMLGSPIPASIPVAMAAGSFGDFATLIPGAPGAIGTFDVAVARVVTDLTTVGSSDAVAFTLLVHAALFFPIVLLGGVFLIRTHVVSGSLIASARAKTLVGHSS